MLQEAANTGLGGGNGKLEKWSGERVSKRKLAELTGFEPNLSPFFAFSIYKASRYLKLNRKFREIFAGMLAVNM